MTQHLHLVANTNDEYVTAPNSVTVAITPALAAKIRRYATFVNSLGEDRFGYLSVFDYSAQWSYAVIDDEDEEDEADITELDQELRTEGDKLVVSSNDFYFTCCLKHSDVEVYSEHVPVTDLDDALINALDNHEPDE